MCILAQKGFGMKIGINFISMGNEMKRRSVLVVAFFCVLAVGSYCLASNTRPVHLRILAGPEGGQWFLMSGPITEILSREVLPSSYRKGGGISNLEMLNKKMADFAFSLTSFLGGASSGAAEYKDIKADGVSLVGNVYPQVLYFLVRTEFAKKYQLKSVGDILRLDEPVRLATLKKGTGSEFFLRILLKYGYNTDYAALRKKGWQIYFNNYPETADDFVVGNLDCFAYTAGTRVPLLLDIENYTKFTALSVGDDVLEKLKDKFKFNSYVIEPSVYKGITSPVKTLSDFTCMVVRRDIPGDFVYELLSALWKHRDEIAETLPEFKNFSSDTAIPEGMPLHPGAEKFWNQVQR